MITSTGVTVPLDNIKLNLVLRDQTYGTHLIIYEDGIRIYLTGDEYEEFAEVLEANRAPTAEQRKASWLETQNPCGELPLGEWMLVSPWTQAHMANSMRLRVGLMPFSVEEIQLYIDSLQLQIDNPTAY